MLRAQILAAQLALALACSPAKPKQEPAPAGCRKFGDPCEFAPGKLGVCIAPEGCTRSDCLLCQSQH